jgi:hypothetical protein
MRRRAREIGWGFTSQNVLLIFPGICRGNFNGLLGWGASSADLLNKVRAASIHSLNVENIVRLEET